MTTPTKAATSGITEVAASATAGTAHAGGKLALVLGATGGVGRATALALMARGWRVRALHRRPDAAAALLPGAAWVAGDAMCAADVAAAAQGASLILHGVNPPGYRNWPGLVLPMLDNTIAAARAAGARIVLPGTIYNYGPDAFPVLTEDAPQRPDTRKGAIRVEMERRLEAAAVAGVPSLILRGGDFFGPHTTANSWFSSVLVKGVRRGARPDGAPAWRGKIVYPGDPRVGHAWAYLPDFAETIVRLVERRDAQPDLLPGAPGAAATVERFHFGGHWFDRGGDLAERVRSVLDARQLPVRRLSWAAIAALSPVVRLFRELHEMRYLWREPLRLDNSRLVATLGAEPHTDIDTAVRRSLEGLGLLPEQTAEPVSPSISSRTEACTYTA